MFARVPGRDEQTNKTKAERREKKRRRQRRWREASSEQVAKPSRCWRGAARRIMSCLDYLRDPDYSGASSSGSAPGCFCGDQLFSPRPAGLSCLSPARDQLRRQQRLADKLALIKRRHSAALCRRVYMFVKDGRRCRGVKTVLMSLFHFNGGGWDP